MSQNEKSEGRVAALIEVKDLFGLSGAAKIVAEGIIRGVGEWARPWQTSRMAKSEVAVYQKWSEALGQNGLPTNVADLTLGERTTLRLSAQHERHQLNRESVALQIIEDVRAKPEDVSSTGKPMDPDWLDRFWTLAENVSDVDFQSIWARILVRQATGKASYSPRTLNTLSMLTRDEAEALSRLAPFSITTLLGGVSTSLAIWSTVGSSLGSHYTAKPKMSPDSLDAALREVVGPVRSDVFGPAGIMVEDGWAYEAYASVQEGVAKIRIANKPYDISGFPNPLPHSRSKNGEVVILAAGVRFSAVGAEIIDLIAAQPSADYVHLLQRTFQLWGLSLAEGIEA
ncbi:hypothetical protein C7U92_16580 [Bradyrhizobium sp. WBOS7]|uniref:DUF2806 domain-containing protein n=1 Tax=Bradyrhizobium betae TaxID=244734 RepID=A0AAE9NA14_9BRAD|nr:MULTISPECIES: DUF2806 domain-containing protein [Bradyrhizobium]MDD1570578.1 hypothetical protein [Bradyrhizobium sp. WBOS1]UUO34955.1 hypothetical protein DCK84_10565 [Bradyrhizobium sp. WBOS01]MDD1527424.1 hypothetical protein [Bradyrhizobium sp. WBOS2]MDD1578336.1 hypothetical protein [Bradyrhizobium sp. WBOS7]MDD1601059.1 hypothetical protein [Bradyrhizobium sp. WBOS16]